MKKRKQAHPWRRTTGATALAAALALATSSVHAQDSNISLHTHAWSTDTTQVAAAMPRQGQWTLQSCIAYALNQNTTIRQSRLSAASADIDVKQARASYLPSLQASVGQNLTNRPNAASSMIISGSEVKTSSSKTSYNGNYSLNAGWTVFDAARRGNLERQKLNLEVADLQVAVNENNVIQNITKLYVQVLYAAEAIKVSQANVEVSQANAERARELMQAGALSKADCAQLESQLSQNRYQLVTAQTSLQNYKLQLKQLLLLPGEEEMDLYLPPLPDTSVLMPLPSRTDVYNAALALRPEIKAGQIDIEAADLGIKNARAGYMPTVSMNAGISTNNMNRSGSLGSQLSNNWANSVGVTLSVPIYDRRQTKSQVQKARIQKQNAELSLQSKQQTLYADIETVWLDAGSAQQQYISAREQLNSAEISFGLMQEQFNLGMKNTVELLTEQAKLLTAQNQLLQAKYLAIMNRQVLRFYAGEEIDI